MVVWIKNPYYHHDARCMEHYAPGHHNTHLDINVWWYWTLCPRAS